MNSDQSNIRPDCFGHTGDLELVYYSSFGVSLPYTSSFYVLAILPYGFPFEELRVKRNLKTALCLLTNEAMADKNRSHDSFIIKGQGINSI